MPTDGKRRMSSSPSDPDPILAAIAAMRSDVKNSVGMVESKIDGMAVQLGGLRDELTTVTATTARLETQYAELVDRVTRLESASPQPSPPPSSAGSLEVGPGGGRGAYEYDPGMVRVVASGPVSRDAAIEALTPMFEAAGCALGDFEVRGGKVGMYFSLRAKDPGPGGLAKARALLAARRAEDGWRKFEVQGPQALVVVQVYPDQSRAQRARIALLGQLRSALQKVAGAKSVDRMVPEGRVCVDWVPVSSVVFDEAAKSANPTWEDEELRKLGIDPEEARSALAAIQAEAAASRKRG
mmetsp:Transcript_73759/g.213646  ORF Transcript_73759/g.213646 Transcript_73759/m.213646 type:complete len:297 (-) Transcript_73759:25-915(-)